MTSKESTLEFLKQQKKLAAEERRHAGDSQKEWLIALSNLMNKCQEWMKEAEKEKLFSVVASRVKVHEERLGTYEAPSLRVVTPSGSAVYIVPKGRFVVGAGGRVDLECPPRNAILLRKGKTDDWQFADLAPSQGGWRLEALTEESFWKKLGELLS